MTPRSSDMCFTIQLAPLLIVAMPGPDAPQVAEAGPLRTNCRRLAPHIEPFFPSGPCGRKHAEGDILSSNLQAACLA